MEAWIGERWHRLITRAAKPGFAAQAVALAPLQPMLGLLFRAAGGAPGVRVVPAGLAPIGGPRGWLQRLAGSGRRAAQAQLDGDTLALPPLLAVFDDAALNRALYLWLAVLAAVHRPGPDWLAGNQAATALALQRCPGLAGPWQRLLAAHLAQRPQPADLSPIAARAEAQVQAALRGQARPAGSAAVAAIEVAPVWLWLQCLPGAVAAAGAVTRTGPAQPTSAPVERSDTRRRTRPAGAASGRAPMLLPARNEALLTWSEHVPLDRGSDDQPDPEASAAADDMAELALSRAGAAPASRVNFDLDLPSASADDLPLGPGLLLPEWDWQQQRLRPDFCSVVTLVGRPGAACRPAAALLATGRRLRRRLALLRAAPRWQRGCSEGEAIDLDAWVRHQAGNAGRSAAVAPARSDPAIYARPMRAERSLATLLLADLSLSTDAHVNNEQRVIDVIRDALLVFGEALHGSGDAFEMLGFCSVRRSHVRLQHLKGFEEAWGPAATARVGAIKPGFYTRMGAAIRAATLRLAARPERQRLLLILTDGKPNDIDVYEGRWGLEDTRHAVRAARAAGLLPFCLSIDAEAHAYLPHLFGRQGWAQVRRPAELPARLSAVYAGLTR